MHFFASSSSSSSSLFWVVSFFYSFLLRACRRDKEGSSVGGSVRFGSPVRFFPLDDLTPGNDGESAAAGPDDHHDRRRRHSNGRRIIEGQTTTTTKQHSHRGGTAPSGEEDDGGSVVPRGPFSKTLLAVAAPTTIQSGNPSAGCPRRSSRRHFLPHDDVDDIFSSESSATGSSPSGTKPRENPVHTQSSSSRWSGRSFSLLLLLSTSLSHRSVSASLSLLSLSLHHGSRHSSATKIMRKNYAVKSRRRRRHRETGIGSAGAHAMHSHTQQRKKKRNFPLVKTGWLCKTFPHTFFSCNAKFPKPMVATKLLDRGKI